MLILFLSLIVYRPDVGGVVLMKSVSTRRWWSGSIMMNLGDESFLNGGEDECVMVVVSGSGGGGGSGSEVVVVRE